MVRALWTVASILARFRTILVSSASRSTSGGSSSATRSASKPAKASRNPSHLASMTRQLIPDWKAAFVMTSR